MGEPSSGNRRGLFLFGLTLSLGLIISTSIAIKGLEKIKSANQMITVKGYAERRITSDWALWRESFTARGADLISAYDKLQKDLATILTYLEKNGIKRESINISSVYTDIRYKLTEKGQATNQIEGYVLSQTVSISSSDIKLIERISKESTTLIKEGVELTSHSPEYFYTKINDLKIEMLKEAAKDARLRAEQLASASGSSVGALRSAEQGVFQITPAFSTEVSDSGEYDTSTIEKSIKAIVTMEYAIR